MMELVYGPRRTEPRRHRLAVVPGPGPQAGLGLLQAEVSGPGCGPA